MQTVESVELAIQKYQQQQDLVVALIQNIRREPSWHPDGARDARSEQVRSNNELEFQQFARHAGTMQDVIGWFRAQVSGAREIEQEKLNEIGEQMGEVAPMLQGMAQSLWTMLNAFRAQRGAMLYPPLPARPV